MAGFAVFALTLVLAIGAGRQLARSERASTERAVETRLLDASYRLEAAIAELAELAEYGLALARLPAGERSVLARRRLTGGSPAEVLALYPHSGARPEIYRSRAVGAERLELVAPRPPAGAGSRLVGPEEGANGELIVVVWATAEGGKMAGAASRWRALLAIAGLDELVSSGYDFRLTRGDAGGTTVLARSGQRPLVGFEGRRIDFPGGSWRLAVAPRRGPRGRGAVVGLLGTVLSLLLGLTTFALARKPLALARQHAEELAFAGEERRHLMRRVTEYQREDERLREEFFKDPPTGLPTRAYLLTRVEGALESVRRDPGLSLSLLLIELGEFRSLVDAVGSRGVDAMLREVASRLTPSLGARDLAARISPDELAVMIFGHRGEGAALTITRSIQRALGEPFTIAGSTLYAKISFGLAHSDQGLMRAGELLANADLALRRARRGAPGELAEYAAAMREQAVSEQLLESDLRAAIEHDRLEPYYQPIVDLANGRLMGFEALVRWQHAQEGFISPGRFIPLAEDSGLAIDIDRLMLRRVCERVSQWTAAGVPADFYVSVNLSARHLLAEDIAGHVAAVLSATGLAPQHLRLEITESALIGNFASALEHTRRLKALGLKLLLDDFGTGYSSLSYLHRFEFDVMKVDGSFVRAMTADGIHRQIVRTVLSLSRDLGMSAIAEGIEDDEQRAALLGLGCAFGQGYLFAPPLPSDGADARLRAARLSPG